MAISISLDSESYITADYQTVDVQIPERPLKKQSLQVRTHQGKNYQAWTEEDHGNSFVALRNTAEIWRKEGTDQYLVFGRNRLQDNNFNWEIVPYYKTSNVVGRIWQQFVVLWRIVWGGTVLSSTQIQKNLEEYRKGFKNVLSRIHRESAGSDDAFCKDAVIKKQTVLEGKTVNVLYNYAPIGFGGERLHFLVVPKNHRATFSDITSDEYKEAMSLTQKLVTHFSETRPIEDAYLYHKTGRDAGQTVPHWHLHVVLISNKAQDIFGKLRILKNLLFYPSPMKDSELIPSIEKYRSELRYIAS